MIAFEVEWTHPEGVADPVGGAWGRATLTVDGETVWGASPSGEPGVEWRWADLLEHLTQIWPWLVWDQSYPLDLQPRDPLALRDAAQQRWEGMPDEQADVEDEALHIWEHRHGLNLGLGALYAPGVVVLRQGHDAIVCALDRVHRAPLDEVIGDLVRLGDTLAAQVERSERPAARDTVSRWRRRDAVGADRRWSIEAGGDLARIAEFLPSSPPADPFEELPIVAAARMTRSVGLKDADWADVAQAVTTAVPTPLTDDARACVEAARAHFERRELAAEKDFEQGYEMARWLRERLGKGGRIDPRQLLSDWGVAVADVTLFPDLEALALWRNDRAVVLLNSAGRRGRGPGLRATLAHESCHLLLDKDRALPVLEVLGGAVPRGIEQRANAFAAELLVPRHELDAAAAQMPETGAALVERLRQRYRASRQIVAWQLINAGLVEGRPHDEQVEIRRLAEGWPHSRSR